RFDPHGDYIATKRGPDRGHRVQRPAGRRAQHQPRPDARRPQMVGDQGHGPDAARSERAIVVAEGRVVPAGLRVAQQQQRSRAAPTHQTSSRMVPVPVPLDMVAPDGDERFTKNVSSPSTAVSPFTLTATDLLVSPAAKLRM